MSKEEILADLKKSVETWDIKLVQEATQKAIDANISVSEIIGDGLGKGMEVIGDRFDKAEIFLPQVVAASKTMEMALKILEPLMTAGAGSLKGCVIAQDFLDAADENEAQVIGGSALMTTTLESQRELVEAKNEVEAPYKCIFGGAPCSQEWCDQIGADGYSETANEIIGLVDKLVGA